MAIVQKTNWRSIWIANLVAFIGSVQSSSIVPTLWPYLKKVDVSTTETLYGFVRGLYSLGQIIFSILSGYISNQIEDTKPSMIAGKLLVIVAVIFFCFIGIFPTVYIYLFFAFEFIFGIATGLSSVYRTHVAMASTEADRVRAYGSTQLSTAFGLIVGPVLQMIFSQISYPGIELFFGIYLNLYTAPAVLAAIISIVGIILLIFFFDGKMHTENPKKSKNSKSKKQNGVDLAKKNSFEKLSNAENVEIPLNLAAIAVLVYSKVVAELVMLNLATIIPPYTMTAFQWSSEQAIMVQSVMMGCVGVLIILFSSAFVFLKLGTKISERFSICVGMTTFLFFHLITYPWDFYGGNLTYLHEKGKPAPLNLAMAQSDTALQQLMSDSLSPNSSIEIVGCRFEFTWCQKTPQIDFPIFAVSTIIAMGLGFPLVTINLDVLYSKVLGPIKQGTLQGIFIGVSQIMNIVGPMLFAKLYTSYGPKVLWTIEIFACGIDLAFLLIFYRKMISWDGKKSNSKIMKNESTNTTEC